MSRRNLSVEVPENGSSPRTPEASGPLHPEGSAPSGTVMGMLLSPGAAVTRALASGMRTVKSPFVSKNSDKKQPPSRRVSVNPLARAANDVTYRHSLELTDKQMQEFTSFKAPPPSGTSSKAVDQSGEKLRRIPRNYGVPQEEFITNRVVTSKYNVITFLPFFLFEMFSRAAYLYFLVQAGLSWWSVVSPFGGLGATAALIFVLAVAGVKAVWEDVKRHQEDMRMNTSITHRVEPDGSVTDIAWTDVKVGDFIMVKDDELFPADIACIYAALPDQVCFIKTTNLDGETNLKIRKPLDLKGIQVPDLKAALDLSFLMTAELPNKNLHKFRGRVEYLVNGAKTESPVTMSEMLLRGCMLKNSHYVVGMVVYTGKESRIQMNAAKTPLKIGSFDRFLNLQISLVILMQISMALFFAIGNYIWQHTTGRDRFYLALNFNVQGVYSSFAAQVAINFLTFWILLSYLVPISLFVTMEIVKFWQGFIFINFDKSMMDPKTGEHARCRNSALNEDLGKVEYVFSDKTGTLTSNEMQLRMIAIKGVPYGTVEFRLENHPQLTGHAALKRFDARLDKAVSEAKQQGVWAELLNGGGSRGPVLADSSSVPGQAQQAGHYDTMSVDNGEGGSLPGGSYLGHHLVDFWINVCLCQSLIIEEASEGEDEKEGEGDKAALPVFQGPSPDEVALVEAARQVGFEFKSRSMSSVTLSIFGEEAAFEILNVMEYSSERGCMSVIARCPDGCIRLHCKGSDTKVMAKLRGKGVMPMAELHQRTEGNLSLFARQGLRTLVLGTKIISEEDFAEWDSRYQDAAGSFEDRDEKMNTLGVEIEQDLELVGVTAIEDKLQDGVPVAIDTLLDAGIKVWMITGDKQETAINIGVSCKLVSNVDTIMIVNVDEKSGPEECERQARARLRELLDSTANLMEYDERGDSAPVGELAVDGPTLNFILADEEMTKQLAELSSRCASVVVCRSSPSQKAAIVRMMMEYELRLAAGNSWGPFRWYKRYKRRLAGKMLSIGDGANDVAMLQTADVGIGIMGKEGRQAVNNSDYAISQFRFLVPLLLIHGNLSYYRLARLIKYSFYKNITFAFMLCFYQFYNGYSGQALVDSITAAVYNVVFTSLPILLFSILDRPVKNLAAFIRYPQLYNKRHLGSLTTSSFWKTGVLLAIVHAATIFFVTYYSLAPSNQNSIVDVYSLGRVAFVALLGTVTLEAALIARYWTWLFAIFTFLSYFLVFPFMILFPLAELAFEIYDPANVGVGTQLLRNPSFWFIIIIVYLINFGIRFAERTAVWAFKPHDTMILAEKERKDGLMANLSKSSRKRLSELGMNQSSLWGLGQDEEAADVEESATQQSMGAKDETLRSHYSGSPHSSQGGNGMRPSPRHSPGGGAAANADGSSPTKTSETSLRKLASNGVVGGGVSMAVAGGGSPRGQTSKLKLAEVPPLRPSSRLLGSPRPMAGRVTSPEGLTPRSGQGVGGADSLEAWSQGQPGLSAAGSSKRVTFDAFSTTPRTPRSARGM